MPNLPPFLPVALLGTSPLCYVAGYGVGIAAFAWMAKRRGLSTIGVWTVAFVGLFGGLIGANLAQYIVSGGTQLGKTVLGGILGGYLSVHFFKKRIGLTRPLGDLFAFGLSAGEAVGRWGCFFGGCCYGKVVSSPAWWTVHQHDAFRYPTQIFLSLASTAILVVLLILELRRFLPENGIFYIQGFLACAARFVIEFYRDGSPLAWGWTSAQFACVAGMIFFGVMFALQLRGQHIGARSNARLSPS